MIDDQHTYRFEKANTPPDLSFPKKEHQKRSRTVTYLMALTLNLPPVAFYFLIDHCM